MDKDVEWRPSSSSGLPRYPLDFKKTVVSFAEKFSNREAERTFGIAESNIRRWKKLKPILFSDGFVSDSPEKSSKKVDTKTSSEDSLYIDHFDSQEAKMSPKKDRKAIEDEEVCLRWNSHYDNIKNMFPLLLKREQFVDVTLSSGKKVLKCHKLVLSACSEYFENMLADTPPNQHVIIFINTVPFWLLEILVDFMYTGEVQIDQNKLQELLAVAEILQIKGLTGKSTKRKQSDVKKECDQQKEQNVPQNVKVTPEKIKPIENKTLERSNADIKPIINKDVEKEINDKKIEQVDDEMPLLKPVYLEDTNDNSETNKKYFKITPPVVKKIIRKRKSIESTPPVLYRKGTKSRPQVKVPRYYHNEDYDHDDLKALRARSLHPIENVECKKDKEKEKKDCAVDKDKGGGDELEKKDIDPLECVKIKTEIDGDDDSEVVFTEISQDY